jgi:putative flippase GtrA
MSVKQYQRFLINGGLLGLLGWAMQTLIFFLLGGKTSEQYGLAAVLAYAPLILLNFLIQQRWIFKSPGWFSRFFLAHLIIMCLVALLSPYFRELFSLFFFDNTGDLFGFVCAALVSSVPSFFLQKLWVFRKYT